MSDYKHNDIVPYQESKLSKKQQVEEMFDSIAGKYDFLNRFLSLGIDVLWRKKAIKYLQASNPQKLLDVATGTADLAIMLAKLHPKQIIGIDISQKMLDEGVVKIKNKNLEKLISLQKADSENLPFSNDFFDGATVAFGVRNFQSLDKGLSEIYRVLQPNAIFVILEFSKVKTFPLKQFYNLYFRYITPTIGKIFSKSSTAYHYLPESVAAFPEGQEMCSILQNVGFKNSICKPLSFGIASLYISKK